MNRQATGPRFLRYSSADLVAHFSYDRVFQTPSFENILLSSSTDVESIDPGNFLRLPVKPSQGNYYEAGLTKAVVGKIRLDANYFHRLVKKLLTTTRTEHHNQLSDFFSQRRHLWSGSKAFGS